MNDTNELPVINCEDSLLLMGDTDSRRSALEGLVGPSRHRDQDYNGRMGGQRYLCVSVKTLSCRLKTNPIFSASALFKMSEIATFRQLKIYLG